MAEMQPLRDVSKSFFDLLFVLGRLTQLLPIQSRRALLLTRTTKLSMRIAVIQTMRLLEAQDVASDEDGAEVRAQRGRRREALERQRQRSAVFASRRAHGFASDASLDHNSESDSDSEAVVLVPAAAAAAAAAAQASSRPAYPVRISFRAGLVQNHDGRG